MSPHWWVGFPGAGLPGLIGLSSALGATALPLVTDVADRQLGAWWRAGELMVGVEAEGIALRPLVGPDPISLPQDLSAWQVIGASCADAPQATFTLGERVVVARAVGSAEQPRVQLVVDDEVRAEGSLAPPAVPCEIVVAQLDPLPGLEILVAWRAGDGDAVVRGLSIFRAPVSLP